MKNVLQQLDQILRGEKTRPDQVRDANLSIDAMGMSAMVIVLGVVYGFFMGSFALARGIESGNQQMLTWGVMQTAASMVKVPILFLSTLGITFPSLYVFNALVGSRLRVDSVFRLLVAALAVNLAVLASMGPIVAFFSVSTPNYTFVLLLNVVVCGLAGFLGLAFLLQTLHRMTRPEYGRIEPENAESKTHSTMAAASEKPLLSSAHRSEFRPAESAENATAELTAGPLKQHPNHVLGRHVKSVFAIWVIVFGLVGAQMSWVLRPFIGSPTMHFQWLRVRDSNFFEAVWRSLTNLLS